MKANMKRIQIDLDAEDVSDLKALAASRGHLLKPFIEYLLRVQIGALPEVQPVKDQPLPLREPSAEYAAMMERRGYAHRNSARTDRKVTELETREELRAEQASKAIEQRQEQELHELEKELRELKQELELCERKAWQFLGKANSTQRKEQPQESNTQEAPQKEPKAVTLLKWLKIL